MGRIFSAQRHRLYHRLGFWLLDIFKLIIALPQYISPKPLRPAPLTKEELESLQGDEDHE